MPRGIEQVYTKKISNEQKLKYIQVILEECSDSELEQVLIDVAVHFLKELREESMTDDERRGNESYRSN